MPSLAVVIPAHNEARTLREVLDGLVRQRKDDLTLDVVVVNDGSTDATPDIVTEYASKHAWLRLLTNEQNLGLAGSLARGISETKGDVVITHHADIVAHRDDWLLTIAEAFEDPEVGAVGSFIHSRVKGLGFIDRFFLEAPPRPELGNKSDAYRRTVLEQLGGFDRSFRVAGEDVDLGHRIRRAGYRVEFPAGMDVDHVMGFHQMGLKKHLRKEVQYAEVQPRLYRRHGYMTTALHGVTVALIAFNAFAAFAAPANVKPGLWVVNLLALAGAAWLNRRHRLGFTAGFAAAYVALGIVTAALVGADVANAPAAVFLLGIAVTFLGWDVARGFVKARRLDDWRVAVAAVPLFMLQDLWRGFGFWKGARGFITG